MFPDPANDCRFLRLEEFLKDRSIGDSLPRGLHREMVLAVQALQTFLSFFPRNWGVVDGLPSVFLRTSMNTSGAMAQRWTDRIVIDLGLIAMIIRSGGKQAALRRNFGPTPLRENTSSFLTLMWCVAHEIFHIVNRHDFIEHHFGRDKETLAATEYDADNCATAIVYRFVRARLDPLPARESKLCVMLALYPFFRDLVEEAELPFEGGAEHPHMAARLMDMVGKLAQLSDAHLPDVDTLSRDTAEHLRYLLRGLLRVERAYVRKFAAKASRTAESILVDFQLRNSELEFTLGRHLRWDAMQHYVLELSRLPRSAFTPESKVASISSEGVWVIGGDERSIVNQDSRQN